MHHVVHLLCIYDACTTLNICSTPLYPTAVCAPQAQRKQVHHTSNTPAVRSLSVFFRSSLQYTFAVSAPKVQLKQVH